MSLRSGIGAAEAHTKTAKATVQAAEKRMSTGATVNDAAPIYTLDGDGRR